MTSGPNPRRALLLALGASSLLSACIVVPARGPYGAREPLSLIHI